MSEKNRPENGGAAEPPLPGEREDRQMLGYHGCTLNQPSACCCRGLFKQGLTKLISLFTFYSGRHCVIFFLSLGSVIIPFPPHERKDRNNPAEIYGSLGANPFVPEQVENKSRAG